MNINKEHSPLWVKVTIWVTIFAFVFAFIAVGFFQVLASMKDDAKSNTANTKTADAASQISTINQQYQTQATSTEALVKKDPKNKDEVAQLASIYSQWGTALMQIQNSNDAQKAALEQLTKASQYWKQAYDLDPKDKEIAGDYATSLYYINDAEGAIKVAQQVVKENPKYATVWYNLGIYLSSSNTDEAIKALENAVKYETDATQKKAAQQALDAVKKQSKESK